MTRSQGQILSMRPTNCRPVGPESIKLWGHGVVGCCIGDLNTFFSAVGKECKAVNEDPKSPSFGRFFPCQVVIGSRRT